MEDDSRELDPYRSPMDDAVMGFWGGKVCIRLRKRKNKPRGDIITRTCSCLRSQGSSRHCGSGFCAVCILWPVVKRKIPVGGRLFSAQIAQRAGEWLRSVLRTLQIKNWDRYTLHCLRRGAARELVERGGTAADLCLAGSWGSNRAFARYLDLRALEGQAASTAQNIEIPGESDSEVEE